MLGRWGGELSGTMLSLGGALVCDKFEWIRRDVELYVQDVRSILMRVWQGSWAIASELDVVRVIYEAAPAGSTKSREHVLWERME